MRRFYVWMAGGVLATLVSLPAPASAQGYSVNEHSACAMARAGTGTGRPCADGSAMFYNPAGLAGTAKGHGVFEAGVTMIGPRGNYTDDLTGAKDDLESKWIPVPTIYATYGLSDRITAGIGAFAPYGLETNWEAGAMGRFLGYKSVIRNIYVQPTIAIRLHPRIDFGAGFDLSFSHVQLRQRLDLSEQSVPPGLFPGSVQTFADVGILSGTDFADANLHGNSKGTGYHLGLIARPTDRLSLGVRYMSRQHIDFEDGTVEFDQINTRILLGGQPLDAALAAQFADGATLSTQDATTAIRLPEQLSFGAAFDVTPRFRLLADATMTNWKVFDALVIRFEHAGTVTLEENFKKAWAYRFGGEYGLSDNTILRLGFLTHKGASPDESVTPNLPEGDRSEVTAGVGTALGKSLRLDLAYQYIDQADRRGRIVPDNSVTTGLYAFHAHLFGASFTYSF
jgi:long-chain fatty acid transport protein